jgi:fructose-1,6-bisphosphatase/inositol monophosphatase family enzyme
MTGGYLARDRGSTDERSSYWLVNPICGTRNFASGIPLYCVNVGSSRTAR